MSSSRTMLKTWRFSPQNCCGLLWLSACTDWYPFFQIASVPTSLTLSLSNIYLYVTYVHDFCEIHIIYYKRCQQLVHKVAIEVVLEPRRVAISTVVSAPRLSVVLWLPSSAHGSTGYVLREKSCDRCESSLGVLFLGALGPIYGFEMVWTYWNISKHNPRWSNDDASVYMHPSIYIPYLIFFLI